MSLQYKVSDLVYGNAECHVDYNSTVYTTIEDAQKCLNEAMKTQPNRNWRILVRDVSKWRANI